MSHAKTFGLALATLTLTAPVLAYAFAAPQANPGGGRVFELRTYHTYPGRLDALNARFRDHTNALFKKHGMELVGFWTPHSKEQGKENTLVYILAYPSRDAATASWKAFQADPEWKKAREASETSGKIVEKVESVFLDPTDYSPIR